MRRATVLSSCYPKPVAAITCSMQDFTDNLIHQLPTVSTVALQSSSGPNTMQISP